MDFNFFFLSRYCNIKIPMKQQLLVLETFYISFLCITLLVSTTHTVKRRGKSKHIKQHSLECSPTKNVHGRALRTCFFLCPARLQLLPFTMASCRHRGSSVKMVMKSSGKSTIKIITFGTYLSRNKAN